MSLAALQRDFRDWLTDVPVRMDYWVDDHARAGLDIYHNAYRVQLVECLKDTFEKTFLWIGEDAFIDAARVHIERTPPSGWTLGAYGVGFDETLADLYPDDAEIAELAWLDWALSRAFEGADAAAIAADTLGEIDWDRAILHLIPFDPDWAGADQCGSNLVGFGGAGYAPCCRPAANRWHHARLAPGFHAVLSHDRSDRTARLENCRFGKLFHRAVHDPDRTIGRGRWNCPRWVDACRMDRPRPHPCHQSIKGMTMRHLLSALLLASSAAAFAAPAAETTPVVVELFQSQGCSSCPPADMVLNELAGRPDVIALNFAVTYWDYLGWKDSFAQPAFTQRQWDYAKAGGRNNVATPQMIVNGRVALLGSRRGEVDLAINRLRGLKPEPPIRVSGNRIDIGAGRPDAVATLWLVRYDPRAIAVPIKAGENGGRTIVHKNVVRELTALGSWHGGDAHYIVPKGRAGLEAALILQAGRGGPVIAARRI